jgi:hypothetical protein
MMLMFRKLGSERQKNVEHAYERSDNLPEAKCNLPKTAEQLEKKRR